MKESKQKQRSWSDEPAFNGREKALSGTFRSFGSRALKIWDLLQREFASNFLERFSDFMKINVR
jgi:hypothetical protein